MTDENPWPADFDPREALAEADGASEAMGNSTEAPRIFTVVLTVVLRARAQRQRSALWLSAPGV